MDWANEPFVDRLRTDVFSCVSKELWGCIRRLLPNWLFERPLDLLSCPGVLLNELVDIEKASGEIGFSFLLECLTEAVDGSSLPWSAKPSIFLIYSFYCAIVCGLPKLASVVRFA